METYITSTEYDNTYLELYRIRVLRFEVSTNKIAIAHTPLLTFILRKLKDLTPIEYSHELCIRQKDTKNEIKVLRCFVRRKEKDNSLTIVGNLACVPIWFDIKSNWLICYIGPYPRFRMLTKEETYWPK